MRYFCISMCCADGKDLYIGKAVQKAYLEVTEEGSEGAVGSGGFLSTFPILKLTLGTLTAVSKQNKL